MKSLFFLIPFIVSVQFLFAQSDINTNLKLRKTGVISGEIVKERLFSYDLISGQDTFQIKKINIVKAYDDVNNGRSILRQGFYGNWRLGGGQGFSKRILLQNSFIQDHRTFIGFQLGVNLAYQLNSYVAVGCGAWLGTNIYSIDTLTQFRAIQEQFAYYPHIRLNYRFNNATQNQLWLIANIGLSQEIILGTTFYGKGRSYDIGIRGFRYAVKYDLFINFSHFEEDIREISLYFGYTFF